jgi:tubulin delta
MGSLWQAFIVNQVVWPYKTGEVIVQNYNAVLTLSHLYQTADAIVVMENDELHKICSQLLGIKVGNIDNFFTYLR